jgi:hypothetical protein
VIPSLISTKDTKGAGKVVNRLIATEIISKKTARLVLGVSAEGGEVDKFVADRVKILVRDVGDLATAQELAKVAFNGQADSTEELMKSELLQQIVASQLKRSFVDSHVEYADLTLLCLKALAEGDNTKNAYSLLTGSFDLPDKTVGDDAWIQTH